MAVADWDARGCGLAKRSKNGGRSARGGRARGRNAARKPREGLSASEEATLPELSSLTNVPDYQKLSFTQRQRDAFQLCADELVRQGEASPDQLHMGCVVRLDRGFPAIVCPKGLARAEFAARLTKGQQNSKVAVGDWVCVRCPAGHDRWLIEKILPRRSDIARWRGKARGERQTLAANVDVVLVSQALGPRPIDCDRVVRSAVIARDCGARVAVVLTKADRASDEVIRQDVGLLHTVLGPDVSLVVTSSQAQRSAAEGDGSQEGELSQLCTQLHVGWGTEGVRDLVGPGVVAIVLGESGAGKSTLLNALLRDDVLRTAQVRQSDDAGRHTTVSRRMVSLPGAGVIVDEPGLRSLPLVGHERGLAQVFPDIAQAAMGCRFRDCTHTHEPGCQVRAGLEAGEFPPERVEAYVSLAAEMRASAASLDPDVVL